MENCCHSWAGGPSWYVDMLDKLPKWIWRTVGSSFATSLEPLVQSQNVASLGLFYRYYFGRCSSKLAELVPLPYSWGGLTCYSNRLNDVTAAISWCYKIVYINSSFPCIARLWTSLPAEWFPLSYEFRVYRRLLSLVLSKQLSYLLFNFFFLLALCLLVVAHLCMEWISIIKEILFDCGIV